MSREQAGESLDTLMAILNPPLKVAAQEVVNRWHHLAIERGYFVGSEVDPEVVQLGMAISALRMSLHRS